MWIPPFWAGVVSCLAFELVVVVFAALMATRTTRKDEKNEEDK